MPPRDTQRSRVFAAEDRTFQELQQQSSIVLADGSVMDRKWTFSLTGFARKVVEEAFMTLPQKWVVTDISYKLSPKTAFNRTFLPLEPLQPDWRTVGRSSAAHRATGVACAAGLSRVSPTPSNTRQVAVTFRWKLGDTQYTPHGPMSVLHQLAHLYALPMYPFEGLHGPAFCRALLAVHHMPWDAETWDEAHYPMVGSGLVLAEAFKALKVKTDSLTVAEYEAQAQARSDVKYAQFESSLRDLSRRLKP